jgi:transposase InsO family protein
MVTLMVMIMAEKCEGLEKWMKETYPNETTEETVERLMGIKGLYGENRSIIELNRYEKMGQYLGAAKIAKRLRMNERALENYERFVDTIEGDIEEYVEYLEKVNVDVDKGIYRSPFSYGMRAVGFARRILDAAGQKNGDLI